ncbi:MAG: glycosyltransferase [Chitinophagaceae bacterium]|nr:MAG: glycosyltransferase [Chitinophagaceae bacterium]
MISIIIPTFNEAENIAQLVNYLFRHSQNDISEIIISDGGSADDTIAQAAKAGALSFKSPAKGRAAQMNYGAAKAKGDILYFVHADTFPPDSYVNDINQMLDKGYRLGRYRTKFDSNKGILKLNAFFTRFDLFMCYGGDQTLFIQKELFHSIGGFDNTMGIMEDYEIITRAREKAKYAIIQKPAIVSARKYDHRSWLTVQMANYRIIKMYKQGASQKAMVDKYKQLLGL